MLKWGLKWVSQSEVQGFQCHFQNSSSVNQLTDPLWKRLRSTDQRKRSKKKKKEITMLGNQRKEWKQEWMKGKWQKISKQKKWNYRRRWGWRGYTGIDDGRRLGVWGTIWIWHQGFMIMGHRPFQLLAEVKGYVQRNWRNGWSQWKEQEWIYLKEVIMLDGGETYSGICSGFGKAVWICCLPRKKSIIWALKSKFEQ